MHRRFLLASAVAVVQATVVLLQPLPSSAQPVPTQRQPAKSPKAVCVHKAGEATGITRSFAEYEALLIIRQVTGNWPVESDRIGPVSYDCRQLAAGWTCRARAKVCKR